MSRNVAKQERVALLLAAGRTQTEAAAEAGVAVKTIQRWREDPRFIHKVSWLRSELLANGLGKLSDATVEAADVLRGLLKSNNEAIRLAAARSVLQVSNELRKTVETEELVEELQRRLNELQGRLPQERS